MSDPFAPLSFLGALGTAIQRQRSVSIDPGLAKRIRFVGLDVDGVLTDGGIYLGGPPDAPFEFKRYDIQDGLGIYLMRQAGIRVGILTGRGSHSVAMRARELELDDLVQDAKVLKLPALRDISERTGIALDEMAFIGDDLPDVAVLRAVGLAACVANATPEAWRESKLRLTREGGRGAVREFAELLLGARGEWDAQCERYVRERSGDDTGGVREALL